MFNIVNFTNKDFELNYSNTILIFSDIHQIKKSSFNRIFFTKKNKNKINEKQKKVKSLLTS